MKGEDIMEVVMRNLASDLATTLYIDGDYKHALNLLCEFRKIVEALLVLRKMRGRVSAASEEVGVRNVQR